MTRYLFTNFTFLHFAAIILTKAFLPESARKRVFGDRCVDWRQRLIASRASGDFMPAFQEDALEDF